MSQPSPHRRTADHRSPATHAPDKRHRENQAVTEFVELPDRGHSLTIDHGWAEVGQTALDCIRKQGQDPSPT